MGLSPETIFDHDFDLYFPVIYQFGMVIQSEFICLCL